MSRFGEIRLPGDAPLEGPPHNAEESLFLSMPELARAADLAVRWSKISEPERKMVINDVAGQMVNDPDFLTAFFDAIAVLGEVRGYKVERLRAALEQGLKEAKFKTFPLPRPTLSRWLTLYAESDLYRPSAKTVIRKMLGECPSRKKLMSFLYELTLCGVTSSNPRLLEKVLELLALRSDLMPPDSKQAADYFLATFDDDDKALKQAMEIDAVLFFVCSRRYPDLLRKKNETYDRMMAEEDGQATRLGEVAGRKISADTERGRALRKFYDYPQEDEGGMRKFDQEAAEQIDFNAFPWNLVRDAGELRLWLNDYAAQEIGEEEGRRTLSFHLPGAAGHFVQNVDSRDVNDVILEALRQQNETGEILSEGVYWNTLAHLLPDAMRGQEVLRRLADLNRRVRQEMRDNPRYLLSPRGDLLEVADEELRALGFRSLLFEMDSRDKRDTLVTARVGNFDYKIRLDEHFALRQAGENKDVVLPTEGEFIIQVILSHLREIRCSEKVNETGGERGTGARRAFTSRRAHVRRLPEGHKPTPEQIARALEVYGVDIVRLNRERETQGEGGMITFVFEAEDVALGGRGPVCSRAPEATLGLWKLVDK